MLKLCSEMRKNVIKMYKNVIKMFKEDRKWKKD